MQELIIIIINCCAINVVEMLVLYIFFFLSIPTFSKFIPRSTDVFRITVIKKRRREREREEGRNTIDGEFVSGLSFRSLSRLTVRLRSPNERESNARTTRPLVTLRVQVEQERITN